MTWRTSRTDFERWLRANGAEPLGAKQNEFMRFQAHGVLCIVYEPNRKGRRAFVPELAERAFATWQARGALDLANDADVEIEGHHARSARLHALHLRQAAGQVVDFYAEASTFRLSPERLVETLAAWARSCGRRDAGAPP